MKHRDEPDAQALERTQTSPRKLQDAGSLVDALHSIFRDPAAASESGPAPVLEYAPEVRVTTTGRFRGFLEWLLVRCLGELAPPVKAPVFLGESERRLILDTADQIGREVLGATPADPKGSVVVRLVLDRCSGAPCAGQGAGRGAARTCPGPDGGARRQGEIGHFCIGGSLGG